MNTKQTFTGIFLGFLLLFGVSAWLTSCNSSAPEKPTEGKPEEKQSIPSTVSSEIKAIQDLKMRPLAYFSFENRKFYIVNNQTDNNSDFEFEDQENVRFGISDSTGKVILPLEYNAVNAPNALATGFIETRQKNKWGLMHLVSGAVLPAQFDLLMPDFNGGIYGLKNGSWSWITFSGEFKIISKTPTQQEFSRAANVDQNTFKNSTITTVDLENGYEEKLNIPNGFFQCYNGWKFQPTTYRASDWKYSLLTESYRLKTFPTKTIGKNTVIGFFDKLVTMFEETRGPEEVVMVYKTQKPGSSQVMLEEQFKRFSPEQILPINDTLFAQCGIGCENFEIEINEISLLAGPQWNLISIDSKGYLSTTGTWFDYILYVPITAKDFTSTWFYYKNTTGYKSSYPPIEYFKKLAETLESETQLSSIGKNNLSFVQSEIARLSKLPPITTGMLSRLSKEELYFCKSKMNDISE